MRKKIFTLLTALVLSIGIGWAGDWSWTMDDLTGVSELTSGSSYRMYQFMFKTNGSNNPKLSLFIVCKLSDIKYWNNMVMPPAGSYKLSGVHDANTISNIFCEESGWESYIVNASGTTYYLKSGTISITEANGAVQISASSLVLCKSNGSSYSGTSSIFVSAPITRSAGTISVAVKSGQSAMGTVSGGGYGQGGDKIQISATANEGYAFKQWNDGNKENPRTVVVDGDQTYTAEFMEVVTIEDKNAAYTQGNGYFYVEGSTTGYSAHFESTQAFYTGNFTAIDKDNSWVQPAGGSKIYFNNATCKISRVGLTTYCLNAVFSNATEPAYNMIFYFDHIIDGDTDWDIKKSFSNAPDVYVDDNDENIWWITTPWEDVGWEGWWSDFAVYIDKSQQPAGGGIPTGRYFVNYPATAWSVVPTMKYSISSGSSNPSYDGTIIGYYNNGWNNWFFAVSGYIDVYNDGNGHHTFSANFQNSRGNTAIENYGSVPTFYAVTATGEHGTVTGTGYFPSGATINLTAVGDEDYTFLRWSDDNTQNPRPVTVTGAMEFTAIFGSTAATHKVTFKNYDGSVLQEGQVEEEQTPAYTGATPTKESTVQYDYTFSGWNPAITAVGTEDQVYTATFSETLRQYAVTITTPENGTLTVEDGAGNVINNGDMVDYGTVLTVTATPSEGYHLDDWIGGVEPSSIGFSTSESGTITVEGAVTIGATFAINTYTLTIGATENGTITMEGAATSYDGKGGDVIENIPYGTHLTFTATADQGYQFITWTNEADDESEEFEADAPKRVVAEETPSSFVDGGEAMVLTEDQLTSNPLVITIDGDLNIGAMFEMLPPFNVTIHETYDGYISVSDGETTVTNAEGEVVVPFPQNAELTLTLHPDNSDNQYVDYGEWVDADDETISEEQERTITLSSDMDLYAAFMMKEFTIYESGVEANYEDLPKEVFIRRVTLVRTFKKGTWSTMCLPFDDYVGDNVQLSGKIHEMFNAEVSGNKVDVYFNRVNAISAGYPYMYYSSESGVTNPVFDYVYAVKGVTAQKKNCADMTYCGVLTSFTLPAHDDSYRYISSNKLYYPTKDYPVPFDRGYFEINKAFSNAPIRMFVEDSMIEEADQPEEIGTKKYIEDGILVIERNDVKYNAQGQVID